MKFVYALFCILVLFSCQKFTSCEGNCKLNQSPLAIAGNDQTTALPKDSILLDGSASSDPDGKIISYKWTQLSGPSSNTIEYPDSSITIVRALIVGEYQFELQVTDDRGKTSKDITQITVTPTRNNKPPVANAGPDQNIPSPSNPVTLDGTASFDPDGTITNYVWKQIAGPNQAMLVTPTANKTQVTNLMLGVYLIELTVTDNDALSSKDTMQIIITGSVTVNCEGIVRTEVNVPFVPVGTLSVERTQMSVAAAANKVLFAGGHNNVTAMTRVDIFNNITNLWSTAELTQPRSAPVTAVWENKIYFGGGGSWIDNFYSTIDVYDAAANIWNVISLPVNPRRGMVITAAAAAGKVVFLTASTIGPAPDHTTYTFAEIFHVATNTWSTDTLHQRTHSYPAAAISDAGITSTVIGDKMFFAGNASNFYVYDGGSVTAAIDIYDARANTWSRSSLNQARGFMASIAVGTKNYWAGGYYKRPQDPYTQQVEIRDVNAGTSTFGCLFQPNAGMQAVEKNNSIAFFTTGFGLGPAYFTDHPPVSNKFDIYRITSNTWQIGVLPVHIYGASIIAAPNSNIYVAGGFVNGVVSKQVWKMEF